MAKKLRILRKIISKEWEVSASETPTKYTSSHRRTTKTSTTEWAYAVLECGHRIRLDLTDHCDETNGVMECPHCEYETRTGAKWNPAS